MNRTAFRLAQLKSVWLVCALLFVIGSMTGCAATGTRTAYQSVTVESVFRERVVDRPLSWPGGFDVRFTSDGRITGQFPDGKVEGLWQWQAGRFCRSIAVGGIARPKECLGIELSEDQVRFKRENGGYFLPYRIGPSTN